MSDVAWRQVGKVGPGELGPARHQAHSAIQWLARVAQSYVDPADDQSHTSLAWDDAKSALETTEIAPGLTVEYRLSESTMQFKENGNRSTHQILLDDRSPAEVEAWFLIELLHRHIDRDRFSKALPYELPDLMSGDAEQFEFEPIAEGLEELSSWYANAAATLEAIRSDYADASPGATPVRCWPHQFEIATTIGLSNGQAKEPTAISVGMSPGDEHYDEPYFFVRPSPRLSPWELPDLPELGHWHKKGFVGAVATASDIVAKQATGADMLAFLRAAIEISKAKLSA